MLIYAIDDEQAMLEELHDAIEEAEPSAEIIDFKTARGALNAIKERKPDVVFSDIQMPGMDGLSLAVHIKNEAPNAKIIFVTGFSEYALEAYNRHINGYIMKPIEPARIREELDNLDLPSKASAEPNKLRVQCFGNFDVFSKGKPLIFKRKQTKELFAYLIDREGSICTGDEIISALWEDSDCVKDPKHYLRVLTQDLRETLTNIGMEDVLIRENNCWAVQKELLDCDYYRMLAGDSEAVNAYYGEYMSQYSWAELTAGRLYFRKK
jgi:two-component SAPR family response regulator